MGELLEPGTMAEVATEIAKYQPCCPVVLNTSGQQVKRLSEILMSARWNAHWATPTGGDWLKQDWPICREAGFARRRAAKGQKAQGRSGTRLLKSTRRDSSLLLNRLSGSHNLNNWLLS